MVEPPPQKKLWRSGWQALTMLIAEIYAVTKIGPSIATKMKHSHSQPSNRKGMKEKECVMHNVVINLGPMSTV